MFICDGLLCAGRQLHCLLIDRTVCLTGNTAQEVIYTKNTFSSDYINATLVTVHDILGEVSGELLLCLRTILILACDCFRRDSCQCDLLELTCATVE